MVTIKETLVRKRGAGFLGWRPMGRVTQVRLKKGERNRSILFDRVSLKKMEYNDVHTLVKRPLQPLYFVLILSHAPSQLHPL